MEWSPSSICRLTTPAIITANRHSSAATDFREGEFAQWLDQARNAPSALDRGGYVALLQESQNVRPFTYRAVEPGLFAAIVTQQIPPGPGPSGGSGGVSVRPSGAK